MQTINQDLASSYPPPPVSRNMGNHSELMIFSVKAGGEEKNILCTFSCTTVLVLWRGETSCDATAQLRIPISFFSSPWKKNSV